MKKEKSILLLLFIVTGILYSCIGDSMKNCHQSTVICLNFPNTSLTPITKVNIGIYDRNGYFIQAIEVKQKDLDASKKVYLSLPPDNYTAVCWGNAQENTIIKGFESGFKIDDGEILNPNYENGGVIATNDPLYYVKVDFTVIADVTNEFDANFTAAYDVITVRIAGYIPPISGKKPMVRIENLDPICNFYKVTNDGRDASYYPFIWKEETDNDTYVSAVLPLNTSLVNNIAVKVFADDTASNILCAIDLNTFIKENNINVEDDAETIIPIVVTFMNGGDVSVGLDNWKEIPINPGI